ncbi:MAG TPA: hypothetical protein VLA24_09330 [Pseudomonadales bacterium]|nr:hypothetical protein [Pseudomonadales bacterium]
MMDMFGVMREKKALEALGPIQGPQETQMERESRELRTSMKENAPLTQEEVDALWRGAADSLPRDYN